MYVTAAREPGEGDGYEPEAIQTLHRRRDDHHPPPDGLAVAHLRPPVPRVGVERVEPGGTPAKRVGGRRKKTKNKQLQISFLSWAGAGCYFFRFSGKQMLNNEQHKERMKSMTLEQIMALC